MHTPKNATKYATFRWLGSHPDSNPLVASLGDMILPFPSLESLTGLSFTYYQSSLLGGSCYKLLFS